jgi:pimeloyl-ACP methyl ester carboxylesterase
MTDPLAGVELEHEDVLVNGIRLHTVTAGPNDGELVVLLHGWPEFWYSWRFQIPALVEAGYRIVAPDLRGYNESEKPHGVDAYRIGPLTGDVAGLIDHYGDGTAHVVGHDWGGSIAWAMGIVRPEKLDRLVVLNAPHPANAAESFSLSQLKKSWYVLLFQLPWLPEKLLAMNDYEAIERVFESADPAAFDDEELERYKDAQRQPGATESALNYYRAYVDDNAAAIAKSALPLVGRFFDPPGNETIEAPTLLLWGEQDEALGRELSEDLEEWVPDIRVRWFSEASHWVQCDVPDRVNAELVDFLDAE